MTLALYAVAFVAGASVISNKSLGRALIGGLGLLVFVLVALSSRKVALTAALVWLILLGFVRRLLIPFVGWSTLDPLLLVSPAVAVVLWQTAGERRRVPRTLLSSLSMFLMLWTIAEIFNPNEPNLRVALQSTIFYVVPLVWFFVGRTLDGDLHDRVVDTIFWMNLPVLALGYYHTFVGFLPFELHWLSFSGPGPAIFLPGFRIRPFSTLNSPQEYGVFLAFASVVILARLLYTPRYRFRLGVLLGLTLLALFLQSSRGILLETALALVVVLFAKTRAPIMLLLFVAAAATIGLFGPLSHTSQSATPWDANLHNGSDSVNVLVQHQVSGLSNPGQSTLSVHLQEISDRISDGIHHPLGLGVSLGTIASQKDPESKFVSGETDIANVIAGFGLIGGFALIALVIAGLVGAGRLQFHQPSMRHAAWLGILTAGLLQWLNGALYATSTLVFVILGGIAAELPTLVRSARRR